MAEEWDIDKNWLVENGFVLDELGIFSKLLAKGPAKSEACIAVGYYPHNSLNVAVIVDGYGLVTTVATKADLLILMRLLDGVQIDHPYEMDIDDDSEERLIEVDGNVLDNT